MCVPSMVADSGVASGRINAAKVDHMLRQSSGLEELTANLDRGLILQTLG